MICSLFVIPELGRDQRTNEICTTKGTVRALDFALYTRIGAQSVEGELVW